ncbi:hypothetical protein GQ42DRAFT_152415 [Ramicandelaber brevisporus]|nr:hypothetical protein GQ42DRAFT_152415 [Ramicandelaber brevisporus]
MMISVDGLDSADIRSYTHFAVYVRTETVQHPEQIDNNSNSNSSIVNNNELSSSVSSATDTAAQHSINLSNPKLSLVPYSDSDDSDDSDSEPGADSDSDSDIPLRSLSPPAIIPSVSSDQTLQQQQEQSNSTPTASTQTVPAKRNHDNAFDDAAPSSPHPPSAATAAVTSSITATSVDSNLDMDELDCMFGHGWRYTRSVPPPSTSSTDTPNDHIGVTSVKKKRKIVDAVSSSDPSTVNTVTSVTASSQTESSAPLLLGESFTTLDGGSISFDELSLELQHYLGKHTYLTLEHQQCIINAWLLIDKRQKQTISSDAAINQHRPQQQQQQQQRIRAAAASSQSSNKECIVFDQPAPTTNSDTVIMDEPGLKVELVIDVDLKQHFAGFCSGMPLAAGADIAAHKAIAYFHSDWCANASTRIMFGKYIEYCLTRVQLHPSRMVVGDFNSVASWMDRVKNARLPTANIEDRESEDYQCLLKKYREEWEHHRESVLLPLSRAGFIDGIHLARCIQGESIDASNISFRFSYFYQLRPRSALDIIFLPPHLLSGAVIQYGPDGGIIPFLDHSPVGLHLPPPATSVGDTLGTIDIPSCYLEALPIPTIMPDIHAPADFHTVTNTFRFDINGSNLGGISMHASASRSSIQHIHPPQSVADYRENNHSHNTKFKNQHHHHTYRNIHIPGSSSR